MAGSRTTKLGMPSASQVRDEWTRKHGSDEDKWFEDTRTELIQKALAAGEDTWEEVGITLLRLNVMKSRDGVDQSRMLVALGAISPRKASAADANESRSDVFVDKLAAHRKAHAKITAKKAANGS